MSDSVRADEAKRKAKAERLELARARRKEASAPEKRRVASKPRHDREVGRVCDSLCRATLRLRKRPAVGAACPVCFVDRLESERAVASATRVAPKGREWRGATCLSCGHWFCGRRTDPDSTDKTHGKACRGL